MFMYQSKLTKIIVNSVPKLIPFAPGHGCLLESYSSPLFPTTVRRNLARNIFSAVESYENATTPNSSTNINDRNLVPIFTYSQDPVLRHDRKSRNNGKKWEMLRMSPLPEIGQEAQELLGSDKFSMDSSLKNIFGNFNEIIQLFTLRNSHKDHPLIYLAELIKSEAEFERLGRCSGENPYPLWRGMMVLLATKMFGFGCFGKFLDAEINKVLTIERHDRMAKVAEIAYITQQIHKRILDSEDISRNSNMPFSKPEQRLYLMDLHNANKTATLVGDLLWAQICSHMAAVKCQSVSELICEFLMDYCESEFIFSLKTEAEKFNIDSWFRKSQLGLGSILGTTMSSMLLISGHDTQTRNKGYRLGVLLGLTYQAYDDIKYFERESSEVSNWLDMGLLPVVHTINTQPELLKRSSFEIFQRVKGDQIALEKGRVTLQILQEDTLEYLCQIETLISCPESRAILERFVISLST